MNLEKVVSPSLDDKNELYRNKEISDKEELNPSDSNKAQSTASSKLLMGNYTIIYVISGSICIKTMHSEFQNLRLVKGEAIVCERLDSSSPADISMTPDLDQNEGININY